MEKVEKKPKKRMTKDTIPEGFTIPLVIVDAIPVLFFLLSIILFSLKMFSSYFIILGGIICFISGIIKIIWKLIVATKKKNIWWMFVQMRIFMPIGFTIFILGFILGWKYYSYLILNASFYSRLFFTLSIIGMSLMSLFAIILDASDHKVNWLEQITNSISQASICLAIIYL